jgi:hypothetical protein
MVPMTSSRIGDPAHEAATYGKSFSVQAGMARICARIHRAP